jgi:hypothetical protein
MSWRTLLMITLLAQLAYFATPQTTSVQKGVVELPQGPETRIPSPDRRWTLIFKCPDVTKERKLWIDEEASHTRKLEKGYDRNLGIAWAPDSQRFFVNDNFGSTGSLSYVIDPARLKTTDLSAMIAANDPKAEEFLGAGHSYLRATGWLNSHELLVVLFGHFDEAPPRNIPGSFTIKYQVDLNGKVLKISQHSIEEPQ